MFSFLYGRLFFVWRGSAGRGHAAGVVPVMSEWLSSRTNDVGVVVWPGSGQRGRPRFVLVSIKLLPPLLTSCTISSLTHLHPVSSTRYLGLGSRATGGLTCHELKYLIRQLSFIRLDQMLSD